ncbi:hypothetical protein BLA29_014389 [Euroglyphus maynei]|uniref:Uncharacterized protein n=1 Tax=Euroglyphus maynei TaxID=6958 RepID=A0A1Y3AZV3_EURMA|nr:hypothetical protein BLA29_014389 [Euroglyphus maynei]
MAVLNQKIGQFLLKTFHRWENNDVLHRLQLTLVNLLMKINLLCLPVMNSPKRSYRLHRKKFVDHIFHSQWPHNF